MHVDKWIEARQEAALFSFYSLSEIVPTSVTEQLDLKKFQNEICHGILANSFPSTLGLDGFDGRTDAEIQEDLDLVTDFAALAILKESDPLYSKKRHLLRRAIEHFGAKSLPSKELLWERNKKYLQEPISVYENPYTFLAVRDCQDEVEESIQRLGYSLEISPKLMNLGSSGFNATLAKVPGTQTYVLCLRYGLLYFFELFIRHCVHLLDWKYSQGIGDGRYPYNIDQAFSINKIESSPHLLESYQELLWTTLMCSHYEDNESPTFKLKPAEYMVNLDDGLRSAVWWFMIAHEYGHILNGDLGSGETTFAKEHLADARGFEVMNHMVVDQLNGNFYDSILGAAIVFVGMDLIYRSVSAVLGESFPPEGATHPHPLERWKRLTRVIYKNSDDKQPALESFNHAMKLGDVIEVLFAYSQPMLEGMSQDPNIVKVVSHNWRIP